MNRFTRLLIPNAAILKRNLVFAAWLAVLLGCTVVGQAAAITVNTTDGGGVNINGDCSLAEATVAANFNVAVDDCASGSAVAEDLIVFEPLFSNGIGAVINMEISLAIGPEDTRLFVPSNRFLVIEGAPDEQIFIWSFGGSGTLTLQGVTFRFGSSTLAAGAGLGGQIEVRNDSGGGAGSLVIERSTFDRGLAESEGGAIGGVVVQEDLDVTISDSSFVDNRSLGVFFTAGGAIALQVDNQGSVGVSIQDTEFSGNASGSGGAIRLDATDESSINLAIENSTFETNSAAGGGAIRADVDSESRFDVQIRSSIFDRNEADALGGGLLFSSDEAPGGFNPVSRVNSLLIEDSLFKSNLAGFGGSAGFRSGSALAVRHRSRGTSDDETLVTIARNSFIGNWAQGPGAAYFENVAILHAENNLFLENRSSLFTGGLVYSHAETNFSKVTLLANTFHENLGGSGQADQAPYDLLINSQDTLFVFRMRGNVINGLVPPSGRFNCVIETPFNPGWNAARLDNVGDCAPGTDSVVVSDLLLDVTSTGDTVHPTSVTPSVASPLVDSWPEFICEDSDAAPLTKDLIGDRRDPGTGLPFDGDGDGTGDCDIGAFERPATTLFELAVALGGTGSGNVSSNPGGIDCPGDCSELYIDGTSVTLTASPEPGAAFDGWSGDCTGTGSCQVTMDQARSVTASFSQILHPLTVSVSGDGQVSSFPAGIACPGDCSEDYAEGTVVTMGATPDAGFSFDGWSGDCSGTGLCQVTMDQARSVTASFIQILQPLTVQVSGDGAVRSTPAGIDCPGDCGEDYAQGTAVTLSQTADPGFAFDGWSGDCSGTGACQVTMDQARSVQATFELAIVSYSVDVEIEGNGIGMVESTPAGIDCPGDCSASFENGELITLNAIPGGSSTFFGWRSDCAPAGASACQILVDQTYRVIAIFGDGDLMFLDGFE